MLRMVTHEGVSSGKESMLHEDYLLVGGIRGGLVAVFDAPDSEDVTIFSSYVMSLNREVVLANQLHRGKFSIIRDLGEALIQEQVIELSMSLGQEDTHED